MMLNNYVLYMYNKDRILIKEAVTSRNLVCLYANIQRMLKWKELELSSVLDVDKGEIYSVGDLNIYYVDNQRLLDNTNSWLADIPEAVKPLLIQEEIRKQKAKVAYLQNKLASKSLL